MNEEHKRIHNKALDLISRREHSPLELSRKLQQRGFDSALIEQILLEFTEQHWLDEARFSESYIHSRSQKGYGLSRISQELQQRGIDKTCIQQVLAEMEIDWFALAGQVLSKRFASAPSAERKQRLREMRFLQYRGFSHDQIRALFND